MSGIAVFLISMAVIFCGTIPFCEAEEVPKEGSASVIEAIHNEDAESVAEDDLLGRYKIAMQHIEEKEYRQAIDTLDAILRDYPDDPQIHYLRGILHHKLGHVGQAQRDYLFLVEHQQADGTIYNNLGAIYASEGDREEAYKWFTHALREDPAKVEVHDNFAEFYREEKDYPEAVSEYKEVIALENNNTRARFNLAVTYAEMEDYAKAQQQWERVLKLDPDNKDIQSVIDQIVAYREEMKKRED